MTRAILSLCIAIIVVGLAHIAATRHAEAESEQSLDRALTRACIQLAGLDQPAFCVNYIPPRP